MLKEEFLNLIGKYSDNVVYNSECWEEINDRYSAPSRYYHNLEHLKNMFVELDKVASKVLDLDTLFFAVFYHDIIYQPTKNNNEHKSALLFGKRISETTFNNLSACKAQIEATKEHKPSTENDTNILLDLDLSILGKSPQEYKTYRENIRKEYQIYPDFIYNKGRKEVLKKFLKQDSIYKTEFFKQQYENQARENLQNELSQLDH